MAQHYRARRLDRIRDIISTLIQTLNSGLDNLDGLMYGRYIAVRRYFRIKSAGTIVTDFLAFLVLAAMILCSPACLVIAYMLLT